MWLNKVAFILNIYIYRTWKEGQRDERGATHKGRGKDKGKVQGCKVARCKVAGFVNVDMESLRFTFFHHKVPKNGALFIFISIKYL